ncbi:delphilin-like [Dorcoceras hygrometricum]|uniref:Delphilin-like n=1 Tax=Dorcoceras hygrometricum TaxID=472368 RepID=A0A2Z7BJ40_9LAMI|nr:delphilin-like [Dorcoceras hygrometricum]
MASAFYSNTVHIDFASAVAMEIPGIVSVLHALTASGLEGFLGCPAMIYESELVEFFNNGSVKDGLVVSTVNGVPIEILEQLLAETFELPVDGLSELSEMPKDKIYDARSIVHCQEEPVNLSGRKDQMKIEYRLLCDIMAKSISVKAGSFNALTVEKFSLLTSVVCGVKMNWVSVLFNIFKKMVTPGAKQAKGYAVQISLLLENIPNLNLGESLEFPVSKILTAKMVHRYISVTDKESTQEVADASPVKQAPKKPGASKKRPAAVPMEAPVVKKTRSLKKKSISSQSALEMVVVAQEAIPIQIIPATPAVEPMVEDQQAKIVEKHPADVVAATAGEQEPVGEQVDEQPAVESSLEKPDAEGAAEETADDISKKADEPVVEPVMANVVINEVSNADDVDTIIQQVLSEIVQSASTEEEQIEELDIRGSAVTGLSTVSIDERHWFDLSHEELIARWDAERPVTTHPDTDEETEVERKIVIAEGVQVAFSQPEYTMEEQADMELNDDDKYVAFSQPEYTMEEQADMELNDDDKYVYEWFDADEAMPLDEIIMTIPAELPLPSAEVEITKIVRGATVYIPGVEEGDWYKATLPKILPEEKGKEPLVLKDPAKGKPPKEHCSLICADIDLLVQIREKVIDEVAKVFHSFSLSRLANFQIDESYFPKEQQVLYWAEAESTGVALQRKMYILLKYRAVLLRKYLDGWIENYVPGEGDSAVHLKVIDMLSDLLCFFLEELKQQSMLHGLRWDRPCCSMLFEGLLGSHRAIPAYTTFEVSSQRQYDDTLPLSSEFFRLMKKRWADICIEVTHFVVSGRLLPMGSISFSGSCLVGEPIFRVAPRPSPVFALRVSEFCTVFVNYSLFSSVNMEDIRNLVGSIVLERTVLRNVQSSVPVVPSAQLPLDPHQSSPIFPDDTSMHFDETDIATPVPAFSLPVSSTVSTDITRALNQLQASLDQISNRDDGAVLKYTILMHLRDIEKKFTARFDAQDRWIGALRNDSNDQRTLLSLEIKSSHRQLHTQITAATIDQIDMQREVKELNAKVDAIATNLELVKRDAEATKEAIFHQLFEFQSQAQANHIILTTQLGLLVDGLNQGGNDKKGEGDSSRGPKPTPVRIERRPLPTPQPSPDNQGSGGIRKTTIVDRNQSLSVEQAAEFV